MSNLTQIRVLCVDDHPLLREGIASVISGQPDLVVQAADGRLAITAFGNISPMSLSSTLRLVGIDRGRAGSSAQYGLDRRTCSRPKPNSGDSRSIGMRSNTLPMVGPSPLRDYQAGEPPLCLGGIGIKVVAEFSIHD